MKKWIALLLTLSLTMAMLGSSLAEQTTPIEQKKIGEGATMIGIYVQEGYDDDTIVYYDVSTDEKNLLDALTKVALVAGEDASWGFNVTTVDGIKADYEGKGEYWSIWIYDDTEATFVPLETPVATTEIKTGDNYLFFLED